MRSINLIFSAALLLLLSCGDTATSTTSPETDPAPAAEPEIKPMTATGEWVSLFNGEDFTGWHTYGKESVGAAWKIADGSIYLDVANKDGWQTEGGGDIVTDKSYANYELELEWKIGKNGNSGIIYNIVETDEYDYPWLTGPEMQVLDNDGHPDGKIKTHRAGDLYDFISVAEENVKPVGEWNKVKLVVTDGKVEHWLNGKKQVEYANKGPEWEAMIDKSKFKDYDAFGMSTSGKISLQDHGDAVWFRGIRIRELGSK
ncbi:DUF1080 domain-containing protein [Neolewinella aurantiaca]|uniref:DUF1080 domain-containing protein n=1 Tax=Neolewinella aurantiaca TaxID=2602767 RepID=A0A5C7FPC8_9BACT|nr:DUF1080 domain-containing protein [Neolewinella aurantiaca]TXF87755.1 DUF1080 domain-containing protein [Neolewinella aurantiaca]